jgi:RNA polymerase sigma factor (sigma-70 family)
VRGDWLSAIPLRQIKRELGNSRSLPRKSATMTTTSPQANWTMWMRAAVAGDSDAYRRFLHAVAPYIRALARSRCRKLGVLESEAEDIVQEVLLAIHLKRGAWDSSREIGPWVTAIARNKTIDAFRRRGRRIHIPIEDVMDKLQSEEPMHDIGMRDIDVLLARLTCQQQEIVKSISIGGASITETAKRLKITEGALRVSLHRALKKLGALYRSSAGETRPAEG